MNAVQLLSAQPWVERLGWTLVHFIWQGALLAALHAAVRGLAGRSLSAHARYTLACVVLIAMVASPLVTFGLMGGGGPVPVAAPHAGYSVPAITSSGTTVRVAPWQASLGGAWQDALPWVVAAWLAGAICFSVRLAGGWAFAARMRWMAVRPAPREWQHVFERLVARMGISRPVRLLISSLVDVPIVVGWLRPVVLAPVGALAGLPAGHVEALLIHELAHVRRHDYLVNLLQSAAEVLLFYHPAVWWVSGQIRTERELCCDDLAVAASGDVLTYAHALAELESQRPVHIRAALAANGGSLRHRIARLLEQPGLAPHTPPGLGAALAVSVLLVAGIGAVAVRGDQRPAPREPAASESAVDPAGVRVDLGGAGVMHRTPVEYPRAAIERRVEGTVVAEVTLDAGGAVTDARILSGPGELRKTVLQSVLQWHFTSGAAGSVRQVVVTFQVAAAAEAPLPTVGVAVRREGQEPEHVEVVTRQFAESERTIASLRERLAEANQRYEQALLEQRDSGLTRAQMLEREQEVAAAQEALARSQAARELGANDEARARVERELEMLARVRRQEDLAGRTLTAIEIRGLSDDAGNDLLSRLPVREGDTLSPESIEAARRTVRQIDEHLELGFSSQDGGGVVLRIHPAGSAGAPLIRRK